jgi:hypothetical protein
MCYPPMRDLHADDCTVRYPYQTVRRRKRLKHGGRIRRARLEQTAVCGEFCVARCNTSWLTKITRELSKRIWNQPELNARI